jgi:hypothetical protein
MAKTFRVTFLVHLGNLLATSMVRLGLKVGPIQLLTVRGRTSGEPRTTPVAVVDLDGKLWGGELGTQSASGGKSHTHARSSC